MAANILVQLAAHAQHRVAQAEKALPLRTLQAMALELPSSNFSFEAALRRPQLGFICECKRASPSKGIIANEYPYLEVAKEYQQAGADAVSVLTEPKWFLGSDEHLETIAAELTIPCLRKDFTVDPYMIYEAKLLGASAVLLICALLSETQIRQYLQICEQLGLSALVEAHDEDEVAVAVRSGARVIGVNNRNLKDFSVDIDNARRLRQLVPSEVLFVSESGVQTAADVATAAAIGADAVLVGETLMRAEDKTATLTELRSQL